MMYTATEFATVDFDAIAIAEIPGRNKLVVLGDPVTTGSEQIVVFQTTGPTDATSLAHHGKAIESIFALPDGCLVAAGRCFHQRSARPQIFEDGEWRELPAGLGPDDEMVNAVQSSDGTVYLVAGHERQTVYKLQLSSSRWEQVTPPFVGKVCGVVDIDGSLHLFGGFKDGDAIVGHGYLNAGGKLVFPGPAICPDASAFPHPNRFPTLRWADSFGDEFIAAGYIDSPNPDEHPLVAARDARETPVWRPWSSLRSDAQSSVCDAAATRDTLFVYCKLAGVRGGNSMAGTPLIAISQDGSAEVVLRHEFQGGPEFVQLLPSDSGALYALDSSGVITKVQRE